MDPRLQPRQLIQPGQPRTFVPNPNNPNRPNSKKSTYLKWGLLFALVIILVLVILWAAGVFDTSSVSGDIPLDTGTTPIPLMIRSSINNNIAAFCMYPDEYIICLGYYLMYMSNDISNHRWIGFKYKAMIDGIITYDRLVKDIHDKIINEIWKDIPETLLDLKVLGINIDNIARGVGNKTTSTELFNAGNYLNSVDPMEHLVNSHTNSYGNEYATNTIEPSNNPLSPSCTAVTPGVTLSPLRKYVTKMIKYYNEEGLDAENYRILLYSVFPTNAITLNINGTSVKSQVLKFLISKTKVSDKLDWRVKSEAELTPQIVMQSCIQEYRTVDDATTGNTYRSEEGACTPIEGATEDELMNYESDYWKGSTGSIKVVTSDTPGGYTVSNNYLPICRICIADPIMSRDGMVCPDRSTKAVYEDPATGQKTTICWIKPGMYQGSGTCKKYKMQDWETFKYFYELGQIDLPGYKADEAYNLMMQYGRKADQIITSKGGNPRDKYLSQSIWTEAIGALEDLSMDILSLFDSSQREVITHETIVNWVKLYRMEWEECQAGDACIDKDLSDDLDQSKCESIYIKKIAFDIDSEINEGTIGESGAIPMLWKSCIYRIPLEANYMWWYRIFSTIIGGQIAYLAINPLTQFVGSDWDAAATLSSGNAKFIVDNVMIEKIKQFMLNNNICHDYKDRIDISGIWNCTSNVPIDLPAITQEPSPPFAISPGIPQKWKIMIRPVPSGSSGPAGLSVSEEYGEAVGATSYGVRGYYENYRTWNEHVVSILTGENVMSNSLSPLFDTFYSSYQPINYRSSIVDVRVYWYDLLRLHSEYNHVTPYIINAYAKAIYDVYKDDSDALTRIENRGYLSFDKAADPPYQVNWID